MVKKPSTLVLIGIHTVDTFRIHHIDHIEYLQQSMCAGNVFFDGNSREKISGKKKCV